MTGGPARLVRRVAVPLAAVLVLVALVVGLAGLELTGSARDLAAAVELIDDASVAVEEGRLADARDSLDRAYERISTVNAALYGPAEVEIAGALPLVRSNLQATRDGVALATRLVDGGRRILAAAGPLEGPDGTLEVSLSDGSFPLAAIDAAQQEIRSLVTSLPAGPPDLGPGVVGRLADAARRLNAEALRRRAQLGVLDRGLSLVNELAGGNGDRTYLLAIANTAEMRGSGGMVLDYGVLTGSAGTIDLAEFGRVDELAFTGPVPAPSVPADYLARWSGFEPLSRWRQANLAGDFTVVAPVLESMYEAATGQRVDGVLQLDPQALAGLLEGIGPVSVAELGEVRAEDVVDLTLNEAYLRFPGVEARTDVLGDVAEAALRRLVDGEIPSLRRLATGMVGAVDGRHLLIHTPVSSATDDLAAFAADGSLPPLDSVDSFHLTAQNLSGNKLDYYLDTTLDLRGALPDADLGRLQARVTLASRAPASTEPAYIFGPGPTINPLPAGVLRSLVTLYLPLGTEVEAVAGDPTVEPAVTGTEAGRPFASFTVDVPAGQERSLALDLRLAPRPPGTRALVFVPSPRVRPTALRVDVATSGGSLEAGVELDRTWVLRPGRDPAQVEAPVFR